MGLGGGGDKRFYKTALWQAPWEKFTGGILLWGFAEVREMASLATEKNWGSA